jgi:hypothetical protein
MFTFRNLKVVALYKLANSLLSQYTLRKKVFFFSFSLGLLVNASGDAHLVFLVCGLERPHPPHVRNQRLHDGRQDRGQGAEAKDEAQEKEAALALRRVDDFDIKLAEGRRGYLRVPGKKKIENDQC